MRGGKPRQANLRRAVSTAYYALFHCLADTTANLLVGGLGSQRDPEGREIWRQGYRALDHAAARRAARPDIAARFPEPIRDVAAIIADMQQRRHLADYDPHLRLTKSEVLQDIAECERAILRFSAAPIQDRRRFILYLVLRSRP